MTLTFPPIHLVAVIVTGIAIFFLGAIWYAALFGKLWQKYHGYTDEQVKAMQKAKPPAFFFGSMLFAYLLLATMMAFLVYWTKAETWLDGLILGLVVFGIAKAIMITDFISSNKRKEIYFIDGSYQFCYFILAGIMLTLWR